MFMLTDFIHSLIQIFGHMKAVMDNGGLSLCALALRTMGICASRPLNIYIHPLVVQVQFNLGDFQRGLNTQNLCV